MSFQSDRKDIEALAPLAAAAVGVASPVGGLVAGAAGELFKRVLVRSIDKKLRRWLSDIAAAQEFGSPERVIELIDEHVDEPWAYEGVVQGMRLVLEAVDAAVLPSLAALSAAYFAEKRQPDRFYKRCARLLGDCDGRDLAVQWRLDGSSTMQNVLRLLRANNFAESAVTRDQTPMPYAETSADLRATTRIADDQLHELFRLREYVMVPVRQT